MESQSKAEVKGAGEGAGNSERSTIEFPYTDLDNAVETVKAVHAVGGTTCEYDQLAAQLGVEAKGGGFRLRVNGAKAYGLITYERGGRITLTDLGRRMIDPQQERTARVEAFLFVPLFSKVYDTYRGSPIPPQPALERSIITMGVGTKVADRARQVLLRSAKQAAFFELSQDRLTAPSIRAAEKTTEPAAEQKQNVTKTGGSGGGGTGHPLIDGLIQTLPVPNTPWSSQERYNWLNMANSIFKIIYQSQDEGDVTIAHQSKKGKSDGDDLV